MKKLLLILFVLVLATNACLSQEKSPYIPTKSILTYQDSLEGFDISEYKKLSQQNNYTPYEYELNLPRFKREYIKRKYGLYSYSTSTQQFNVKNSYTPLSPLAAPCVNEDFETGTFAGWTITEGSTSNSCTQAGCCPNNSNTWNQIVTTPLADVNGIIPGTIPNSPL